MQPPSCWVPRNDILSKLTSKELAIVNSKILNGYDDVSDKYAGFTVRFICQSEYQGSEQLTSDIIYDNQYENIGIAVEYFIDGYQISMDLYREYEANVFKEIKKYTLEVIAILISDYI